MSDPVATSAAGGAQPTQGPPRPFFASRWVTVPEHVRDLGPDHGLPAGFRSAGVACGIKPSGNPDLGLIVCDCEKPVSAARFAATGAPAAPLLLSRERCELSALRVALANSGCANAATGKRGMEDAAKTQGAAAIAVGAEPREVILGSTGPIGSYLPVERMLGGIREAAERLDQMGDSSFQQAIQTTDALEKRACLQVELDAGVVELTAQCKGAGRISPRFATMLCYIQTDAQMASETADLLLGVCVKRSFDRCSVDGQLSTNDTAVLMCSGASGVKIEPESEDERLFGEALDALLRQLAIYMVVDGEGAGRIARVHAQGSDADTVELAARAVANSPLVKAALHGGDPNWGRIVQAVGGALPTAEPLALDVFIDGVQVCSGGASTDVPRQELAGLLARPEVEFLVRLPGEGAETEVFFSDLSHEYVSINADYTT
jgi:glutamate N-acetyltransferase / amino-acid N-acetyltransferase